MGGVKPKKVLLTCVVTCIAFVTHTHKLVLPPPLRYPSSVGGALVAESLAACTAMVLLLIGCEILVTLIAHLQGSKLTSSTILKLFYGPWRHSTGKKTTTHFWVLLTRNTSISHHFSKQKFCLLIKKRTHSEALSYSPRTAWPNDFIKDQTICWKKKEENTAHRLDHWSSTSMTRSMQKMRCQT